VEIFVRQGAPPVSTTLAANFSTIFASIVDTSGKFATGVNNTGGNFATGVNDTGCQPLLLKKQMCFEIIFC
jgi:hypothetical protein